VTELEIKDRIKILLNQTREELEIENPKVDFKTKWYRLNDEFEKYEFIRDVTSIVNTPGKDGLIVIGYNEKEGNYHPAKFRDCGLDDSSQIQNLVLKMCSDVFTLNTFDFSFKGNSLSVIHLPPFLKKPVLVRYYKKKTKAGIKEEEQRAFIRKNTRTHYANKNDLDLMYFEREYLKPEYEYDINLLGARVGSTSATTPTGRKRNNRVDMGINIENIGRRSIVVSEIMLTALDSAGTEIKLQSYGVNGRVIEDGPSYLITTVASGESTEVNVSFKESTTGINLRTFQTVEYKAELRLTNNLIIKCSKSL